MKTLSIAAAVLLIAFSSKAFSQNVSTNGYSGFADLNSYQEADFELCAMRYLGSLNYKDCGEIIECGLAQVVMLKLAQPLADHKALRDKINDLVISGETPSIRYKAYLTTMVFDRPEWFVFEKHSRYDCGDKLFTALAERVQVKTLAL